MVLRLPGRRSGHVFLGGLIALPVLAAVGWWQVSPGYTVARLQHAALSGDGAAVVERIDFPALRGSLKSQLQMRLLADARPEPNSLSAVGTGMALAFIAPMVDAAVTPETVATVISVAGEWTGDFALSSLGVLSYATTDLRMERDGWNHFRLYSADAAAAPALVFCRDALAWKLCAVELAGTA